MVNDIQKIIRMERHSISWIKNICLKIYANKIWKTIFKHKIKCDIVELY